MPTREQELLLRAAWWRGIEAIDAWEKWRLSVDLSALDAGSTRVLPQLYLNLRANGLDPLLLEPFKEVYRQAWSDNQRHFQHASALLQRFHDAGIKTMALKGAALIANYYKDFGARPMGDFDILVPTDQRAAAITLLALWGWRPRELLPVYNSRAFIDTENHEIDLHWHVLQECLDANADADFWSGAMHARIGDVSTFILNPTDMLLHICVHGFRWTRVPPIRWVADAMVILNSAAGGIDWARLIAQAKTRALVRVMREALSYLREQMNAPIPGETLRRLKGLPISRLERLDYQARTIPPRLFGVKVYWVGYLRLARTSPLGPFGLVEYLRRVWDLKHGWQVPLFALGRLRFELRWRMRTPAAADMGKTERPA